MVIHLDFETSKDISSLIEETKSYFGRRGFKLVTEKQDFLEFKRGNLFINRFTFNSLKWKSETKITFSEGGKVSANFSIDTTHQFVIQKEINKWDIFMENYKKELS